LLTNPNGRDFRHQAAGPDSQAINRRPKPLQRPPSMAATASQRAAAAGRWCTVCRSGRRIDPAHLIPRSLGGCGDARCVVPLCQLHHRGYDRCELDLVPYLEKN
jgi:hypothetical protein